MTGLSSISTASVISMMMRWGLMLWRNSSVAIAAGKPGSNCSGEKLMAR